MRKLILIILLTLFSFNANAQDKIILICGPIFEDGRKYSKVIEIFDIDKENISIAEQSDDAVYHYGQSKWRPIIQDHSNIIFGQSHDNTKGWDFKFVLNRTTLSLSFYFEPDGKPAWLPHKRYETDCKISKNKI